MKKMVIKLISIISLTCLITTGCWDAKELNTLSVVTAIAVDKSDEPGKVIATAQVLKASSIKSGKTGDGGSSDKSSEAYINVQGTGYTVLEALRNIVKEVSRRPYFQHNSIIILGEDLAKENIEKYIDFFYRDQEQRRNAKLIVAKGKAYSILNIKPPLEKTPAQELDKLVSTQKLTSQTPIIELQQFIKPFISKTMAPVLPVIEISDNGKKSFAKLQGTAVIKKNRLIGYLDDTGSTGFLLAVGKAESGIINIDLPGNTGEIGVEFTETYSKIKPSLDEKDKKLHISLEVNVIGLVEDQSSPEVLTTPHLVDMVKMSISDALKKHIQSALTKSQELNADIFGFGEKVIKKYPRQKNFYEKNWDKLYPDLQVEISVNTEYKGTGTVTKTIISRQSED